MSPEEDETEPGETALGRVIDPDALACSSGARGKLCIEVPAAWLAGGVELEVTAPGRIVCARCEGGGCDGCGRSGALRGPEHEAARVISVRLPEGAGRGALLRIVQPFGDDASIEQLLVQVRPGSDASIGVVKVDPAVPPAFTSRSLPRAAPWVIAFVAAVAVVVALVAAR
jgi:hypothetical protein